MFAKILRFYAYVFHFLLSLFLVGISAVALISPNNLRLEMLPWREEELTKWLLVGGIVGLLSIALAVTGIFRFLFPLWTLLVLVLLVRGYLLQPYTFGGKESFYQTLWFIGGALLAFIASLTLFRAKRRRR